MSAHFPSISTPGQSANRSGGMLQNLKIGARISGGFALILVLLLAIGTIGWFGLSTSSDGFQNYATVNSRMDMVADTQVQMLNMRRSGREFVFTGNKALIDGWDKRKASAIAPLTEYSTKTDNAERHAVALHTLDVVQTWFQALDKVIALREKRDALTDGVLAELGPKGRADFVDIINGSKDPEAVAIAGLALNDFMNSRLERRNFQETGDVKNADGFRASIAQLEKDIAPLAGHVQDPALKAKLADAMDVVARYKAVFEELFATVTEYNRMFKEDMTPKGAEMDKLIAELMSAQSKVLDDTRADTEGGIAQSKTLTLSLSVVAVVLGLLAAWFTGRSIVPPIARITEVMGRLAQRDLTVAIAGIDRGDEIGQMAKAVQVFKANMIKADELADAQRAEQIAKEERAKKVNALTAAFDISIGNVVQAVSSQATQMESSAQTLSATAEESTKQSATVAAASEEAAANVQTVASATEELSSSIGEISRQVAQSSRIAAGAVDQADRANAMVQGLAEASQKIGAVVALITDIANQTNLLALERDHRSGPGRRSRQGFLPSSPPK